VGLALGQAAARAPSARSLAIFLPPAKGPKGLSLTPYGAFWHVP